MNNLHLSGDHSKKSLNELEREMDILEIEREMKILHADIKEFEAEFSSSLSSEMISKEGRVAHHLLIKISNTPIYKNSKSPIFSEVASSEKLIPPKLAEMFLMLVTRKKSREAIIGDLEQKYARNCADFGVGRARRLYWVETIWTVGPLLLQSAKRLGLYTLALAGLKKWIGL